TNFCDRVTDGVRAWQKKERQHQSKNPKNRRLLGALIDSARGLQPARQHQEIYETAHAGGIFHDEPGSRAHCGGARRPGKGILAADETVPTLTKRFDTLGIQSTERSRRTYREMLFTAPNEAEFIGGVILQDETIRQKSSTGTPLAQVLATQGILPGIKVDTGVKPLAGSPGETVTGGLDGLRDRLSEYHGMGARFAKWRAVIHITDALPSPACVSANAHALARYAALCQEQDLVPIVEPEVLMDGPHSIERCEEVTGRVLHAVFNALFEQRVALECILLKPNMIISGKECASQAL